MIFFTQGVCSTLILAQHMLRIVTPCVCVYIWRGYSAHECILCGDCTQPITIGQFRPRAPNLRVGLIEM
jgi:hypothetical protein